MFKSARTQEFTNMRIGSAGVRSLLIAGTVFLPFLVDSVMLFLAEAVYGQEPTWGILTRMGETGGLAAGILCLAVLPIRLRTRVVLGFLYWPIMTYLLFYYGFFVATVAFHRAL